MASNKSRGGCPPAVNSLPGLFKAALAWAQEMEREGLSKGKPLAFWQVHDARDVGILQPERVRMCLVDAMPEIRDMELSAAAAGMGFLGQGTLGLTLGHAVFIRKDHAGIRTLLRHELRHVAQCEQAGGLDRFIPEYLGQIVSLGYQGAPYEADARLHESRRPKGNQT